MELPHRKKVHHYNHPGHAHELTFSCYQRLPLLSRDRSREWLVDALDTTRTALDYSLLCYVLMPEHVHVIVHPNHPDYNVSSFLKQVKQSVSRRAKAWLLQNNPAWIEKLTMHHQGKGPEFRFWQAGGGYDRNIVDRKTLLAMMEYIHNNPVRRGLVSYPAEWPWSSAGWYEGTSRGPLRIDPIRW